VNNDNRAEADRYRSLFEGAQSSLSDLSARQAQALSRVGRLRNAVVTVLRRNFMELSAQAEAQLGLRLSDVDDEILIAYLEAFVSAASRGDQRVTLNAMAEAVAALGVPLRGDEPLLWVEQIHAHRGVLRREQERAAASPASSGAAKDNADKAEITVKPAPVNGSAQTTPPGVDNEPNDYWGWEPGTTLEGLFPDAGDGQLGSLFGDVETPALWDNDLGHTRNSDSQWAPSPVAPADPGRQAAEKTAPPGPVSPPAETTAPKATEKSKTKSPNRPGPKAAPQTTKPEANPPVVPAPAPAETDSRQPVEARAAAQPDPLQVTGDTRAEQQTTTDEPGDRGDAQHAEASEPSGSIGVETPLRPELFPTAPTRRKRTREVRTQATPPEGGLPFKSGTAVLDDAMRQALLAASSIPRPVFTRDLIAVAGDEAVVDAWEAECRADVSTSPVRFVAPKSRHRQRGRLVAVEQGAAKPADWWYQAVSRYRAGRLYELGVLLHRVGDEIVSFQLGEQVCLFRLNTPRGLVGVVVVLDVAAEDNPEVRYELTEVVENLMGERLTLLAVLTASGEPGSLEGLSGNLEQIATERHWRPTFPLVAARSWEYADDRGSSAVMVLNQP